MATARTLGKPGTVFITNLNNQTTYNQTDYVNSLDTILTFESTGVDYQNNYTSFAYLENLDRLKIAHVIHTQTPWDSTILLTATTRGAGFLYVTDDIFLNPLTDNPYDTLTSYWQNFTADVQLHNSLVPEPSLVIFLGIAGVCFLAQRHRWRTRP